MPITNEERDSLFQFNDKEKIIQDAIKKFGKTEDYGEAGYILEDGTMLDFSEGVKGERNIDHDAVCGVIKKKGINIVGEDCKDFFTCKGNAIRIHTTEYKQRRGVHLIKTVCEDNLSEQQIFRLKDIILSAKKKGMRTDIEFLFSDREGNRCSDFMGEESHAPFAVPKDVGRIVRTHDLCRLTGGRKS